MSGLSILLWAVYIIGVVLAFIAVVIGEVSSMQKGDELKLSKVVIFMMTSLLSWVAIIWACTEKDIVIYRKK